MPSIRVRFAPSPTGELHIGGARTALFNYLYARKFKGAFILRIDDTDLERSRSDYIDFLISSLHWLGLDWDEGPYYQSKRLDLYTKEAERLVSESKAYHCYCSIEELQEGRDRARADNRTYLYPATCRNLSVEKEEFLKKEGRKPVIRLTTPESGTTIVEDLIRGEVSFDNSNFDDFIIIKSNGLPTYNFASIVDDLQMGISDVIRAEEHLSNTPRQKLCALALGHDLPRFAHVPMILAPDRSKLSKRHGATSVEEFRREGYLPEALVNYMALLGWSPGDDKEIMSLQEMINEFSLQKVTKTAAIYDVAKLAWMNSLYIREYNLDKLTEAAKPYFREKNLITENVAEIEYAYYREVINAVRERAKTLPELAEASAYFFSDIFSYDPNGVKKAFSKPENAGLLRKTAAELSTLEPFNYEMIETTINAIIEILGISPGRLIQPLRLALSGRTGGPALFTIISLLGKENSVARLTRAAEFIERESKI